MSEERTRILDMLAAGKISVAEAEQLLSAVGEPGRVAGSGESQGVMPKGAPRFLKIQVLSHDKEDGGEETVNIRVPLQLLRSGIKLASLMPSGIQGKVSGAIKEHGFNIDLSKAKAEDLEGLINDLTEMSIDVDSGKDKVRICCE